MTKRHYAVKVYPDEHRPEPRIGVEIAHLRVCKNCGDIELVTVQGHKYNIPRDLADAILPTKDLVFEDGYYNCDSCVNHWSVIQCRCGSGQNFWECNEHTKVCGGPSQNIPGLDPGTIFKFYRKMKVTEAVDGKIINAEFEEKVRSIPEPAPGVAAGTVC